MPEPFETLVKQQIYQGFKGRLLTLTFRKRTRSGGVDEHGDAVTTSFATHSCDGIDSEYSAFYKSQAGIPITDVRVLIIAGSMSVVPEKDDQVKVRDQWFQVRAVVQDPARATYELQSFKIEDPI